MVVKEKSQDINTQLIFYSIIYPNYDKKFLVGARKWEIYWDRSKGLIFKEENKLLICIYFRAKKLNMMLIINLGIYIWKWSGVFVIDKCRYNHKLNKHITEI